MSWECLINNTYLYLLSSGFHVVQKIALWSDHLSFVGDLSFAPTAFFNSPFYSEIIVGSYVGKYFSPIYSLLSLLQW